MLIKLYTTTFYERTVSPIAPAAFAVVTAAVKQTIQAAVFAIVLAVLLVLGNMVTGVIASRREGKTITTKGLRKSIAKLLVYGSVILTVLMIGVLLNGIESQIQDDGEFSIKGILVSIMLVSVFVCYIEVVSILQNALRITPHVRLLEVLYNILTLSYIKKIPHSSVAFERVDIDGIKKEADDKHKADCAAERKEKRRKQKEKIARLAKKKTEKDKKTDG